MISYLGNESRTGKLYKIGDHLYSFYRLDGSFHSALYTEEIVMFLEESSKDVDYISKIMGDAGSLSIFFIYKVLYKDTVGYIFKEREK